MDRSVRYEVLENEDVPAQPVAMAMIVAPVAAPPPYEADSQSQAHASGPAQPAKLPNYVEATTLPSYEEAERSKMEEALHRSSEGVQDLESGQNSDMFSDMTIGTDGMFICTFLISFLFNWLGFLLSLCLSNTVAGRCGALSGLGLSIIKWVAIVKHKEWASEFATGDSWLWWLLFLCGFLLFIRGAVQYVRVKYEWTQLTNRLRRYRLM